MVETGQGADDVTMMMSAGWCLGALEIGMQTIQRSQRFPLSAGASL
jgi:hypothetical protein